MLRRWIATKRRRSPIGCPFNLATVSYTMKEISESLQIMCDHGRRLLNYLRHSTYDLHIQNPKKPNPAPSNPLERFTTWNIQKFLNLIEWSPVNRRLSVTFIVSWTIVNFIYLSRCTCPFIRTVLDAWSTYAWGIASPFTRDGIIQLSEAFDAVWLLIQWKKMINDARLIAREAPKSC